MAGALDPHSESAVAGNHRHLKNVVAAGDDPHAIVLVSRGVKVGQVGLHYFIEQDTGVSVGNHREVIGANVGRVDLNTLTEGLDG
jgi:hypothetical protein